MWCCCWRILLQYQVLALRIKIKTLEKIAMFAYKKYVTIEDPSKVVLSDLPFQAGQRVEVIILVENNPKAALAQNLRELLKETQALHANNPMTEEEIAAEIEVYRKGL